MKKILLIFFLHVLLTIGFAQNSDQGQNIEISDEIKEDYIKIYNHTFMDSTDVSGAVFMPVLPGQVNFYLFTKDNPKKGKFLPVGRPKLDYKENTPVVFIIHGWTENKDRQWYKELTHAFLQKEENFNVIQVDWHVPAVQLYTVSAHNTQKVGEIVADFIWDLLKSSNIPLKNIIVVGHSLGGQTAGYVGKRFLKKHKTKLPRIIALDPAGPLFDMFFKNSRLNENDADNVVVIHTNGGTFGFKKACGTLDFFPNGGSKQPGCDEIKSYNVKNVVNMVSCNHQRSWKYFIDAISHPNEYKGYSYNNYVHGRLGSDQDSVSMGDLTTTKRGQFYFKTNAIHKQ